MISMRNSRIIKGESWILVFIIIYLIMIHAFSHLTASSIFLFDNYEILPIHSYLCLTYTFYYKMSCRVLLIYDNIHE
jgi:hypothetical protein